MPRARLRPTVSAIASRRILFQLSLGLGAFQRCSMISDFFFPKGYSWGIKSCPVMCRIVTFIRGLFERLVFSREVRSVDSLLRNCAFRGLGPSGIGVAHESWDTDYRKIELGSPLTRTWIFSALLHDFWRFSTFSFWRDTRGELNDTPWCVA